MFPIKNPALAKYLNTNVKFDCYENKQNISHIGLVNTFPGIHRMPEG
jgi:hypothetical protein